jgi:hypothetical protein
MYLQKVISRKTLKKHFRFVTTLLLIKLQRRGLKYVFSRWLQNEKNNIYPPHFSLDPPFTLRCHVGYEVLFFLGPDPTRSDAFTGTNMYE